MDKIKDVKIGVIVSASKTLDYMNLNKYSTIEEVMRYVIDLVHADSEFVKRGIIASANFTYKYKTKNYLLRDKEILKEISKATDRIISEIEHFEIA
ncbi:MAG: hypothetical protein AABW83_03115 [Nanoarchaeota archaeon]